MSSESVSHFIGGRYARSALLKTFGVADPATGKEYAQVAIGLAADINQAVLAAQTALRTSPWPDMAPPDMAAVLNAIADTINVRAGDIADAEALGTGLPVTQAREQAARAAGHFRRAADLVMARAGDDASPEPGQADYVVRRCNPTHLPHRRPGPWLAGAENLRCLGQLPARRGRLSGACRIGPGQARSGMIFGLQA